MNKHNQNGQMEVILYSESPTPTDYKQVTSRDDGSFHGPRIINNFFTSLLLRKCEWVEWTGVSGI